jgi:hypothetical protein
VITRPQYSNTWDAAYLPIFSSQVFDNTGSPYNVSRVINEDLSFNVDAYKAYSPLFLSITFILSYGLSFASVTATLTHTFIYYRKQIMNQARRSLAEQPDVHARLMSVYKEVPNWWYLTILSTSIRGDAYCVHVLTAFAVTMFGFGIAAIEIWHAQLPIWAFILALIIGASLNIPCGFHSKLTFLLHSAFVYTIPIGVIAAITNQAVGLNVITELIISYLLPGRPIAVMMFKTWGYISMTQAINFIGDFKLGHYMKIPPRSMFFCQVAATIVAGTTQLTVQAWLFSNVEGICSSTQKDGFICPTTTVFGNSSIIVGCVFLYDCVPKF